MTPTPFSAALTQLRELAGMTQLQLAKRSGSAPSSIHRWESGAVLPKRDNAEQLDAALEAAGELLAVWRRSAARTGLPEWATNLDAVERGACHLSIAAPTLVPGYLQCPEYAGYLFAAAQPYAPPDEIERLTAMRCERLEELPGLAVTAVFPLTALTGFPKDVATPQARRLLTWAEGGRVVLHVVPDGVTLPVPGSPIMMFRMVGGETVIASDYVSGSVTLPPDKHELVAPQFTAALAASLPRDLSLAALERLA